MSGKLVPFRHNTQSSAIQAVSIRATMLAIALVLALLPAIGRASTPSAESHAAIETSVSWLLEQRQADGGFMGFSGATDAGTTADAVIALAAAQATGIEVDLEPSVAFLVESALEATQMGAGMAAKLVLAAVAAGIDPTDIDGVDAVSVIVPSANESTGLYGSGVYDHALGMLALVAAGRDVPAEAIVALEQTQGGDGAWAYDGSTARGAGDTNTTSLVIQAMVAADQIDHPGVAKGIDYLMSAQTEDGGFAYSPTAQPYTSDANSTALVLQALLLAESVEASVTDAATTALLTYQNDSGAFGYNPEAQDDNLFATVQAIPALAGLALPIGVDADATPIAA